MVNSVEILNCKGTQSRTLTLQPSQIRFHLTSAPALASITQLVRKAPRVSQCARPCSGLGFAPPPPLSAVFAGEDACACLPQKTTEMVY